MTGFVQVEGNRLLSFPEWHRDAACVEYSGEQTRGWWFPEGTGARSDAARSVCRNCLVRTECLAFALGEPGIFGVWGGTTEPERARARKAGLTASAIIEGLS